VSEGPDILKAKFFFCSSFRGKKKFEIRDHTVSELSGI